MSILSHGVCIMSTHSPFIFFVKLSMFPEMAIPSWVKSCSNINCPEIPLSSMPSKSTKACVLSEILILPHATDKSNSFSRSTKDEFIILDCTPFSKLEFSSVINTIVEVSKGYVITLPNFLKFGFCNFVWVCVSYNYILNDINFRDPNISSGFSLP